MRRVWDMGHKLPYQLPIELQVFHLGGIYLVGIAAEVCVEVGLHIKQALGGQTVWTLGYANGGWDYFAPESAHTEEGYSEGYEVKRSFMDTIWPWVQPLGFSVDSEQTLLEHVVQMVESVEVDMGKNQ